VSSKPEKSKPTPAQVRAGELKKALKACKKKRAVNKRVACERKARTRYGTAKPSRAANAKRRVR
jgi:hypothetical protein